MEQYQLIGEMLVSKGKLTPEQLDTAIKQRKNSRRRLGEILVQLGFVTEKDIAKCLGEQFGFPVVNPARLTPDANALKIISAETALSRRILPLRRTEEALECVIADPIDVLTTDMIASLARQRTVFLVAPISPLVLAIRRAYKLDPANDFGGRPFVKRRRAPKPQVDRNALLEIVESASGAQLEYEGKADDRD